MASIWYVAILIVTTINLCQTITESKEPESEGISFHHTIAPVAVCDPTRLVNAHEKVDQCHLICTTAPTNVGRAKVTIYKDIADNPGPKAVMCEKLRISQTFTETWTFSKIKGPVSHEMLDVSEQECRDFISLKCPELDCNIHPQDELEPDYYYASDHTVKEIHLRITRIPTTLFSTSAHLSIALATETGSVQYSLGSHTANKRVYIWSTTSSSRSCPFEPSVVYGCDKWKVPESVNFICSQGRFAFESSGSIQLGEECKGAKMSPEGILYKEEKAEPDMQYSSQRISMLTTNKLTGDLETVRVVAANALAHLDSDICSLECEIANIELRTSRHTSSLVRTGAGYILITPKGYGYDCSKAAQCSIVKPYKFCGNPPRVHVKCDGRDYYWNPEYSHVLVDNGCPAPRKNETFLIHLGNHMYNLDDDMTINVPYNYTNAFRTRSYTLTKGSLINATDLPELRGRWRDAKLASRDSVMLNASSNIEHHNILDFDWMPNFSGWFRYISGSFQAIERWVIVIIVIVLAVYVSKPILEYLVRRKQGRPNQVGQGYEMVFI